MQRIEGHDLGQPPVFDFGIYLRTGRRVVVGGMGDDVEVKFNPWHDPEDGRFTFVGQGRFYGAGGQTSRRDRFRGGGGGSFAGGGATGSGWVTPTASRPKNTSPTNDYAVRKGDTLSAIAGRRPGVTAIEIARLNQLDISRPLQIGQQLRLPAPKQPVQSSVRPNFAKRWNVADQLAEERRTITKNGYAFQLDGLPRTRLIEGGLREDGTSQRSRQNQARAGGADRRRTDDGGHYIAVRFNGPRESFNHFPQDSGINRGAYRVLEDDWAAKLREGQKVYVRIIPRYRGTSLRPETLEITWSVGQKKYFQVIPNTRKGR